MENYLGLLLDFQNLPRVRRDATFMEISGYPHYENVCTNVLAFYFNPAGEHGLKNLFLNALFRMTHEEGGNTAPELPTKGDITISREYSTPENKRIDLVIDAPEFTIGIENKIHHWEANDFTGYAATLHALGTDKQVFKILLCLQTRTGDPPPAGGFIRYTYPQFWKHVCDMLGHHLPDAAPKWITHLNDFMTTTARLAGETEEEKEVTDFFMKHHELIQKLVTDRQRLLDRLHARVRWIYENLASQIEKFQNRTSPGMCGSNIVANHFQIQGRKIGLDLNLNATNWNLILWQHGPHDVVNQLLTSPPILAEFPDQRKNGDHFVLREWDLHASEIDLLDALVAGLLALVAAMEVVDQDSQQPLPSTNTL